MSDMTKPDIHKVLQQAYDQLLALHGKVHCLSSDTVFAIGEATGILSKAKALVGRDIDNERDAA